MDLNNTHKDFFEVDNEPDSNVGLNNTTPELPDFQKADSLARVDLKNKQELVKQSSINKTKTTEVSVLNFLKPIGYLIALIAGFVFALLFPGTGYETTIVGAVASIVGLFGLTDWRMNFDKFEGFFKSKTLVGGLLAFIPAVASVVISLVGFHLPDWASTLMTWLLTAGGGTSLVGIFSANNKAAV